MTGVDGVTFFSCIAAAIVISLAVDPLEDLSEGLVRQRAWPCRCRWSGRIDAPQQVTRFHAADHNRARKRLGLLHLLGQCVLGIPLETGVDGEGHASLPLAASWRVTPAVGMISPVALV
jgi:hypothetical protein